MNRKRDRLEIIYDILKAIQEKRGAVNPTHILYKSNLSHQMMTDYLAELISKGFMLEKVQKNGRKYFELTDKGFNYIRDYKIIRNFVDSYDLS